MDPAFETCCWISNLDLRDVENIPFMIVSWLRPDAVPASDSDSDKKAV